MKRIKKILISLLIVLSITSAAPDFTTNQNYIPTVTHVQAKTQYVLVTRTGKKYHLKKCGNGTYYKSTLKKAKASGLTPCKKCFD
ncbi:MAG: hypothetical protein K0S01_3161 [Herbinix sp.]|jgi:hypothetical protein|nr:hypothetical protein [Herbinix sp.]